jgi:arabinoxylan arabinofuranohydrolase
VDESNEPGPCGNGGSGGAGGAGAGGNGSGASGAGGPGGQGQGANGTGANGADGASDEQAGCGCRLAGGNDRPVRHAFAALLGLGVLGLRRRTRPQGRAAA